MTRSFHVVSDCIAEAGRNLLIISVSNVLTHVCGLAVTVRVLLSEQRAD